MAREKISPVIISTADIIRLFSEGLSIAMLVNKVAASERTTKTAAREKVQRVIYDAQRQRRL